MATTVYGVSGYNAAVLSDGLDQTTANTGATAINKLGGGSAKWQSSAIFGGSWALEYVNAASNAATARFPFAASAYAVSVAVDFSCPALPDVANPLTILTIRHAAGVITRVRLQSNGALDTLVGGTSIPLMSSTLVPGNLYRLEVNQTGSAGSATGTVNGKIFTYGAAANAALGSGLIAQTSSTSAATGTNAATHCDIGIDSNVNVRTLDAGNIRLVDGTAAFLGPYVPGSQPLGGTFVVSPTNGAPPLAVTGVITKTGGPSSGTTTCAIDWKDGTTETATMTGTTLSLPHTYQAPGIYDAPTCVLTVA